jgi:hypothetical protein
MEHWEFLIQKDGDRTWLPLESPDAEILEGRYRIVARSNRLNTHVEVRITHQAIEEIPPKRRVQLRSSRTNHEGLMVVIPFTHLKAGIWQFSCFGDVMSDLMGDPWRYTVQLQVLSQAETEDWEPQWQDPSEEAEPEQTDDAAVAPLVADANPHAELEPGETIAPAPIPSESSVTPALEPNFLEPASVVPETSMYAEAAIEASTTPPTPTISLDPEINQLLGGSMEQFLEVAEQMSQQLVDQVLQEFDQLTEQPESAPSPPSPQALSTNQAASSLDLTHASGDLSIPAGMDLEFGFAEPDLTDLAEVEVAPPLMAAPLPSLALLLDQEAYVARRGQFLILRGQVRLPEPDAEAEAIAHQPTELAGRLQICLRDPQSAQILVNVSHFLPKQTIPFSFTYPLEMPDELETRLILGEVALYDAEATDAIVLVTQSFMVTVDVDELLGELARLNQSFGETDQEDWLEVSAKPSEQLAREQLESTYLKLSFLNADLTETEKTSPTPSTQFQSLAGQPLPPQLYQPDLTQAAQKPLQLPTFPNRADSTPIAAETATQDTEPDSLTDDIDAVLDELAIVPTSQVEPENEVGETATNTPEDTLLAPVDELTDTIAIDDSVDEDALLENENAQPELSEEVAEFQSLKLHDRFWARLNSLATDTELSNWLKSNLSTADPLPMVNLVAPQPSPRFDEFDPASREIVVDDDPPPTTQQNHANANQSPNAAAETTSLAEDEPVPTPSLEVTSGELIAGAAVNIRVRLPQVNSRIYVKVWINDCQTRLLLDGPRWLVDFLPTGYGELEAITQLTVPYGSLEIRFEAIALEMQTQRESRKVTATRRIIPPDLPNLSLDEFDT